MTTLTHSSKDGSKYTIIGDLAIDMHVVTKNTRHRTYEYESNHKKGGLNNVTNEYTSKSRVEQQ